MMPNGDKPLYGQMRAPFNNAYMRHYAWRICPFAQSHRYVNAALITQVTSNFTWAYALEIMSIENFSPMTARLSNEIFDAIS